MHLPAEKVLCKLVLFLNESCVVFSRIVINSLETKQKIWMCTSDFRFIHWYQIERDIKIDEDKEWLFGPKYKRCGSLKSIQEISFYLPSKNAVLDTHSCTIRIFSK